MEAILSKASSHIWFDRSESKDKDLVKKRWVAWISFLPSLVFCLSLTSFYPAQTSFFLQPTVSDFNPLFHRVLNLNWVWKVLFATPFLCWFKKRTLKKALKWQIAYFNMLTQMNQYFREALNLISWEVVDWFFLNEGFDNCWLKF